MNRRKRWVSAMCLVLVAVIVLGLVSGALIIMLG